MANSGVTPMFTTKSASREDQICNTPANPPKPTSVSVSGPSAEIVKVISASFVAGGGRAIAA